jgi:Domain of unknown function (DUF932)
MPAEVHENRAVYAKTPAWHRIGTVLTECFTSKQALSVINPNMTPVEKWTAGVQDPATGIWYTTEEFVGTVEVENGVVKVFDYPTPDHTLVQDWEQMAWMDEILKNVEGAHYEAAVKLRGGRQTALTINLGEVILDPQERADVNYKFLFGGNSHNRSWPLMAKLANMRAECANMAAMVMGTHSPEYKTKHTVNIMNRANIAREALGLAVEYNDLYYSEAQTLIETKMTDNHFQRILDTIFTFDGEKDEESINTVRGVYELNPSQIRLYGTLWGGFNAVTYFNDWNTKVRGSRTSSADEMRFIRQFDDTKGLKQKAWEVFTEAAA